MAQDLILSMLEWLGGLQVKTFRSRPRSQRLYPVLRVDALYEKECMDGRIVCMAALAVCGLDEYGRREILAVELMQEKSEDTYLLRLRERGFRPLQLVMSNAQEPGTCTPQGEEIEGRTSGKPAVLPSIFTERDSCMDEHGN